MRCKPSSAIQQLLWQSTFCSVSTHVNGENRVSSLPLPQSQTYPTSPAVLGPQEDFYEDVRLLHLSSSCLGLKEIILVLVLDSPVPASPLRTTVDTPMAVSKARG